MEDTYIAQAATMVFLSVWKTYLGPLIAAGVGFNYLEMLIFNVGAAMSSTLSMLWLTDIWMSRREKRSKGFSGKLRRALRFWRKYGRVGSALLAPVLLGVPSYTVLARRLKTKRRVIIVDMFTITLIWCSVIYFAGREGLLIAQHYL